MGWGRHSCGDGQTPPSKRGGGGGLYRGVSQYAVVSPFAGITVRGASTVCAPPLFIGLSGWESLSFGGVMEFVAGVCVVLVVVGLGILGGVIAIGIGVNREE